MNKARNFSKKSPILFGVLVVIGSLLFLMFDGTSDTDVVELIKSILVRVCPLVAIYIIIKKIDFGSITVLDIHSLGKGMYIGVYGIVFSAFLFVINYFSMDWSYAIRPELVIVILYIVSVFITASFEELLMRGLVLNILIDKYGDCKKSIIKSVLISSIIFGIAHGINLIARPGMYISTLTQIIFVFFGGIFFAAVYLRSKNILCTIFLHTLLNLSNGYKSLFFPNTSGVVSADATLANLIVVTSLFCPFLIVGAFLLKKLDKE